MECNKDEAARAKEIAEKKFTAKDIVGAKKFALKAQNIYPGLEGIPQLLTTLDVYIAAKHDMSKEQNWYGILGVNPKADDETVRKQYRKLALMLHPDKNKSVGADGAFKLVSEAWSLLSDKSKRIAYDCRRKEALHNKKVHSPSDRSPVPPNTNSFFNFTKAKSTNTGTKPPKSSSNVVDPSSTSHKSKPNTFWTMCSWCRMNYEYLRVYLDRNLLCPNCHEPFFASEIDAPTTSGTKWTPSTSDTKWHAASQKTYNSCSHPGMNSIPSSNVDNNKSNVQWSPFSKTGGASTAAKAATVVQKAYKIVKGEREASQAATKKEETLRRKSYASKRTRAAVSSNTNAKKRRCMDDSGLVSVTSNGVRTSRDDAFSCASEFRQSDDTVKPWYPEHQDFLLTKARMAIRAYLSDCNSPKVEVSTLSMGENGWLRKTTEEARKIENCFHVGEKDVSFGGCIKSFDGSSLIPDTEEIESMSINVPDPDFHNFDEHRTERSFGVNQVWATYDNIDAMPRFYALIRKVISLNPFKLKIRWLIRKPNNELGSSTSVDFQVARHGFINSINCFSHKVEWSEGYEGMIRIFPKKSEVWALFRSPASEPRVYEVIHKYEMVEVLEDYAEEEGVSVIPLVKVAGFKTVFHRHLDYRVIRRIRKEEMFQFSHRVPSYLLTGYEAPDAPGGCRELDPKSTPLELMEVIRDSPEEETVGFENEIVIEKSIDRVIETPSGDNGL